MYAPLPAGLPGACSFSGFAPEGFLRRSVVRSAPDLRRGSQERVRCLNIAVKKSRQLGLRQRADAGRLDVAVLEEHQRRDAANAKFGRRALVLVHVDLRHLEAPFVLLRHLVEDWRDRLAWPAPFGPVVDEHRRFRLQYFWLEGVIGDMVYFCARF